MNAYTYQEIPAILTVPQLAEFLSIGKGKAYDLVRSNQIEILKIGNTIRITRHALLKYLGVEQSVDA